MELAGTSWGQVESSEVVQECVEDMLIGLDDMIHHEGFELFKTVILTTHPYMSLYDFMHSVACSYIFKYEFPHRA